MIAPDLLDAFVKELANEEQWIVERITNDAAGWEQVLRARGELTAVRRMRSKLADLYDKHTRGDVWDE